MLARLRRVTSSGRYLPQVDGIRFIAITSVFLFHVTRLLYDDFPENRVPFGAAEAADPLGRLLREGRLGVMVFFALSGFILALPFVSARLAAGRRVSLRSYFLRRVTRIEPPYLVALALVALLAATTDAWGPPGGVEERLVAGAWYGHTIVHGVPNLLNPPFWTLEIEVQFYVLMPVLAVLCFRGDRASRRRVGIAAAALALTLLQVWLGARLGPGHPLGILPNYLQWFAIGFLVADVFVVDWRGAPRTSPWWDAVTLIGWPAFFWFGANEDPITYVLLPWLLLPLFVAVFRGPRTSRALANRWVTTIGGMTYSIYLVHTPVIELLGRHTSGLADAYSSVGIVFQAALMAPAVLLAGLLFYVAIERPCMRPSWPSDVARWVTRSRGASQRREGAIAV